MASEIWNLLNDVRKFIEAEYADPAVAPDGEWLAKEARHIHNKVCTALANGSEPLSRTGAVKAIGVIDTLIESLSEGLMTDAGLPKADRVAMEHQITALEIAKDGIAALEPAAPEGQQEAGADAVRFLYKHGALTHVAAREAVELLTSNGFEISRRSK